MNVQDAFQLINSDLAPIYDNGESVAIARLVIEHITGEDLSNDPSRGTTLLDQAQRQKLDDMRVRLLQQEPVQYVLGEAWFSNLRFRVDKRVLIPRPETEELVEWIISDCKFPVDEWTVLDVGTGSGCIAISIKRRIRKSTVTAIDNSEAALELARQNALMLGADVDFRLIDFLDQTERSTLPVFDVIVSNPPYIPLHEEGTLAMHVRDFEPASALFVPTDDALLFYRHIAQFGKDHLSKDGALYVETHSSYAEDVTLVFREQGYEVLLRKDMHGNNRMVRARLPVA